MPEAGSYTPKFKVGQTVLWEEAYPNQEFIIFSTYKELDKFSKVNTPTPPEFCEDSPDTVMYAIWCLGHDNYYWMYEKHGELYCRNCNRGKKQLIEARVLDRMATWFGFSKESKDEFQTILDNQPIT